MIEILSASALATVQDLGREGGRRWGVGTSGAMDPLALAAGNLLLGLSAQAEAKKPDDNVVAPEQHGIDGRGNRALMPDDEELPPDGPAGEFGIANSWAFSSDAALLLWK